MTDTENKRSEYRKKYEDKRVIKKVSFNTETEKQLLDFAENVDFSQWVKEQIKNNLEK